ncbi:MAG TPA: DUF4097 family beta strand repeat-containing protein [Pyrinomonadaceae bacterium]|nr:DUF4097 family beta strand repeat-containing protein [Pyrinomonadaceae bacterium]
MKRNALIIITTLLAVLLCATAAFAQKDKEPKVKLKDKEIEPSEQMERSIPASQNVAFTLCLTSGNVSVRGWDRAEVKVTATNVRQLELQGGGMNPSQRVEVLASNGASASPGAPLGSDCRAVSDMEISVPRGATVEIRLRGSGDVEVSDVAEARIKNMSGDISLGNVARAVEAATISGDVSLLNSAGRVRLSSVSGDVDATNIRALEPGDDFSAVSTSGDISLENVAQARLDANTTSGMITMTGELARRGSYAFNTFSGDVVLNIPQSSAFRLNAVAPQGSIVTDFAVKSASEGDSQGPAREGRLVGTYGSGDWSNLNIHSFSGTVRLQKR